MVHVKFAEQFRSSFWLSTGPITVIHGQYLTATSLSSLPALYSNERNKFGFSLKPTIEGYPVSAMTTK